MYLLNLQSQSMVRKMSEKIKISEGTIVSFLIGFAYNQGNGIRLSKENTEIIEKINFRICNSINKEIFCEIENKIFENNSLIHSINDWNQLCEEEKQEQNKIKQRLFSEDSGNSSDTVKISQEMIFAFFCGIANSIPYKCSETKFFKIYDKYLTHIAKKFCDNVDDERISDVEHYLNSNQTLFEIRDSIIMASGIKPSWYYPKKTQPDNEEEAMLKKFQEEFK